jgi:hypothetical protein
MGIILSIPAYHLIVKARADPRRIVRTSHMADMASVIELVNEGFALVADSDAEAIVIRLTERGLEHCQ